MEKENTNLVKRGPIVAVMGHIDHGKSTLLSYIRKSNKPLDEAGGITQHISAYEVSHTDEKGKSTSITFLDTPGHEAFSGIRKRGAKVADIAVLVVSAEDGVKPQTLEALQSINSSQTTYIVAINKIDKPEANIERTKQSLAENQIYVEGYGGDIPCVNISAKTGTGVDELLDMIMLVSELENLTGDSTKLAEGLILESNRDMKKGISATCVIKDGNVEKGMFITSGISSAPVRIMENYLGKQVSQLQFPSPMKIIGWDSLPEVGESFKVWKTREEARDAVEKEISSRQEKKSETKKNNYSENTVSFIIKADTGSSLEAMLGEINKLRTEKICPEIISSGIGNISEGDIRLAMSGSIKSIVLGFGVEADSLATNLADRSGVTVKTFDIIYKMSEWMKELLLEKTPKEKVVESLGTAKIIKIFSKVKDKQILGARVEKGVIDLGSQVKIMRRDVEIGEGKVKELQSQKNPVKEISEGKEFGAMIESKIEIAPGDKIDSFINTEK